VVKQTNKIKRLTLDSAIVVTTKETLLDTKNAKVRELLGVGMDISNSTINREKQYEREEESMRRELGHFRYQAKYYKNTT